nr:insulinase family protein [Acidobacteriota bacterium]
AKPDPAMNTAKPGIYFVSKEDVTQANIAMVHPGIERSNPDYPALAVLNEVFGGGFSGRLMSRLRSERGLTYGVGGGVGANWDYPGLFRLQMATKSGTTLESIEALRGEVTRMINEPATADELSLAKESILNAFVFTMDTREKALQQQVLLEFYGFPPDYFTRYPSLIEKVTAQDIARVAKTYLHPDQLAVLVVGNQSQFEKPLSTLGTVTPIDITIPEPNAGKASQQSAPSASTPEGMALLKKVQDFMGGAAAISGIQSMRTVSTVALQTPQGAMSADATTIVQYPETMRQELALPMGTMTTVIAPSGAFMITPMGTQDMPGSRRDAALSDMKSDFLQILRNASNPRYTFTAGGKETVNGVETQLLNISADGSPVRWYVEPSTGRLVRSVRQTTSMGSPAESVTDYADWKKFGPIQMATSTVMSRNGEKAAETKVTAIEVNPAIDAKLFVKP